MCLTLGSCSAFVLGATAAGAQDLRYSLTPTAEQLRWDNALGLDDSFLYGGRLGVVFGKIVELNGFYLTSQGTDSKVRDLYSRLGVNGAPPQNPGLDVMNYGANVVLNFGTGSIAPFVRGGGSVIRFEPTGGRATDRIALQYAGGVRFGKPGGIRFNVYAEDLRFRVDRTLLLGVPGAVGTDGRPVADLDADKLRHNVAYGAGLSVPLGSAVGYNDQPTSSLANLSLPLDVFAGRLDFNDDLGLGKQYLVGARTGIDFGPLVGLRGFYWRGVDDKFKHTQGVQAYGGEAQFSFNTGAGVSPFVVLGAAQIDFKDGYRGDTTGAGGSTLTAAPADRMALIGGGGVRIPVFSHFIVTLAARDYLMSREGRLQDVNETGQLRSSWQYSAGLSLQLGGRTKNGRATAAGPQSRRTDTVFVSRETGQRVEPSSTPTVVQLSRMDTVVVTQRGDTLRGYAADSAMATDTTLTRRVLVSRTTTGGTGYASDRTTQIVVPTEGEIIIRYGPQRAPAPRPVDPRLRDPRDRDDRDRDARDRDDRDRDARDRDRDRDVTRERIYERELVPGTQPLVGQPAMNPNELRAIIRDAVREEMAYAPAQGSGQRVGSQPPARPLTTPRATSRRDLVRKDTVPAAPARMSDADMAAMEQRIVDRVMTQVDARIAARLRDQRPATTTGPASGLAASDVRSIVRDELARTQPAPVTVAPTTETIRRTTVTRPGSGVQGGSIYSGFTFSGGSQALLGARLDVGEISPSLPGFHLVPEIAFGFGNDATSVYAAGNLVYEFGGVRVGPLGRLRPHLSVGGGFINFSDRVGSNDGLSVVFTPAYGVTTDLPPIHGILRALTAGGRTPELLVEHQGIGFFDTNRLIIGLTYRR